MAAAFDTLDRCPKAVVARVNGAAIGGGAGLVACADVAVAVEGARFAFAEVRLGLCSLDRAVRGSRDRSRPRPGTLDHRPRVRGRRGGDVRTRSARCAGRPADATVEEVARVYLACGPEAWPEQAAGRDMTSPSRCPTSLTASPRPERAMKGKRRHRVPRGASARWLTSDASDRESRPDRGRIAQARREIGVSPWSRSPPGA